MQTPIFASRLCIAHAVSNLGRIGHMPAKRVLYTFIFTDHSIQITRWVNGVCLYQKVEFMFAFYSMILIEFLSLWRPCAFVGFILLSWAVYADPKIGLVPSLKLQVCLSLYFFSVGKVPQWEYFVFHISRLKMHVYLFISVFYKYFWKLHSSLK